MDKKLKAKWIKALLGGRYKQGGDGLRINFGRQPEYCCLGVLAQIQGARWDEDGCPHLGKQLVGHIDGPSSFLAPKVAGGLHFATQKRLAEMNDGTGRFYGRISTFKDIAAYIMAKL